ncbi:sensor domain-containing phosphodiesterase [Mycobacterium yunnanensis]|nr:EAL domain-containing protein [Mycobacterium yunnanensis]
MPARDDGGVSLEAAAGGVGLFSLLQPIVALPDAEVVGYEALARWPSPGVDPAAVFAHAARTGRLDTLDRSCIGAAIESGVRAGVPNGAMLAVNCEPNSVYSGRDDDALLDRAADAFAIVFELTERSLLQQPAALLAKAAAIRDDGFVVALDDVGANAESLALLDVLAPEIVKLDWQLIQRHTRRHQSQTLAAILAYHERTGAVILAEGIETVEHLERAMAVGATLGQGYLYGHPHSPTPAEVAAIRPRPMPLSGHHFGWPTPAESPRSPFDLLSTDWTRTVRTARKEVLTAFSRHIERQAADIVDPAMILTALQHGHNLTPATRHRYERLAVTAPLVAILGHDVGPRPAPGVRGVDLDSADPLCLEWTVVTLGPRTASALIAREHDPGADPRDDDRLFDFVLTYDRTLVAAVTRLLLARIH